MEIQQLQVTIEREIQARQQVEKQLKQIKSDIIEKNEFVFCFWF
jgi:septation ring formation regulator EzrA